MENNNEIRTCGKCGTQFQGIKCPECGLVVCKDIISDAKQKLKLLNRACGILMDNNLIPDGVKLNNAYAVFIICYSLWMEKMDLL